MKNVFKYLGIAARFVIDIIAALRAKRTAKKDSEQTLENLKRLYKNNGFDLLERSISLLSNFLETLKSLCIVLWGII